MLGQLIQQLDRSEPKTHHLYYASSQAFARLADGNPQILQQTGTLLERALTLQPFSAEYNIEKGYQTMVGGSIEEALGLYKSVFSLDEGSIEALGGVILCLVRLGRYREAEHQLEFLNEIQKTTAKTAVSSLSLPFPPSPSFSPSLSSLSLSLLSPPTPSSPSLFLSLSPPHLPTYMYMYPRRSYISMPYQTNTKVPTETTYSHY